MTNGVLDSELESGLEVGATSKMMIFLEANILTATVRILRPGVFLPSNVEPLRSGFYGPVRFYGPLDFKLLQRHKPKC